VEVISWRKPFTVLLAWESEMTLPDLPRLRRPAACLLFAVFVALAVACGKCGTSSRSIGTVKVNEDLAFKDSTWVVVEVKDLGKTLKPTEPDDEEKKTDARFILVRFKVTNTGKNAVWVGDDPNLVDDQERNFVTLTEQKPYLPKGARTLEDEDQIPAGITREFYALYEVPLDAKGLRLKAGSFKERRGRPQQEGFIDLGQ
jgi:hypothetical protein